MILFCAPRNCFLCSILPIGEVSSPIAMAWRKKPAMPLHIELAKISKLTGLQSSLPPILRGAPVVAIFAGRILAQAMDGRNRVEEKVLGQDGIMVLGAPEAPSLSAPWLHLHVRDNAGLGNHRTSTTCVLCNHIQGAKQSKKRNGSQDGFLSPFEVQITPLQPLTHWMGKGVGKALKPEDLSSEQGIF